MLLSLLTHVNTKEIRCILLPSQCTNNFGLKLMLMYKHMRSIKLKQNHNCILDIFCDLHFCKTPTKIENNFNILCRKVGKENDYSI